MSDWSLSDPPERDKEFPWLIQEKFTGPNDHVWITYWAGNSREEALTFLAELRPDERPGKFRIKEQEVE